MKKLWLPLLASLLLTGCGTEEKAGNLSAAYAATAVLSLVLLIGYFFLVKKRDKWFLLLFSSVLIVNVGYFLLSVSPSLTWALHANRLAYLGSVFLPMAMLRIILDTVRMPCRRWIGWGLLILGVLVFLVAASPGYLNIYYRDVQLERVDGASRLVKDYGPLHVLYMVYLLGYFAAMVTVVVSAVLSDRIQSATYAAILASAVFVNIGVWLVGQFVEMEFEVLSVSYIVSELFLLGLHKLMAEHEKLKAQLDVPQPKTVPDVFPEQIELFTAGLKTLTQTERLVFECHTQGMTTAQILEKLNIKENTLKYHNRNLYGKLGVSSRKQLVEVYRKIEQ